MRNAGAACGLALLGVGWMVGEANGQEQTQPDPATQAGDSSGAGVAVFSASFFLDSRPNTAFDMVQRTPAFSYNGGDAQVRGLSGAAGNVLIDGRPHTSKAVTLQDVLSRIPASQVVRIEIIRGGAGGVDMMGFSVVANVVRAATEETQFIGQADARAFIDPSAPDFGLRLEGSRRSGSWLFVGAIEGRRNRAFNFDGEGWIQRTGPSGSSIDSGRFQSSVIDRTLNANAGLEYRGEGTVLRSNIGVKLRRGDREDIALFSVPEHFTVDEDVDELELGANLERALAPGVTGRIDTLQTLTQTSRTAGRIGRQATIDSDTGESILRGIIGFQLSESLRIEAGVEGALNFLDQASTLTSANANVRVEEVRAQPSVTVNWRATPSLSLEFGARHESSTISQTGDTESERSFSFFKPRAIAAWTIAEGVQVRLRAEREAKQLDFADFAASSGESAGEASAGNAALSPEHAWIYEAAFDMSLWERSALVFTYKHEEIEDVLDYVPVSETSDARGSVGDGTRDTFTLDMKVTLDRFGIRGGRLEVQPMYYTSAATDPFTGTEREISGPQQSQWRGRINVYLDRPELKSTFALESFIGFRDRLSRIDQVQTTLQPFFYSAWWEWAPFADTTIRVTLSNIGVREQFRERRVYAGQRGDSPLAYLEERKLERGPALQIRVRNTF